MPISLNKLNSHLSKCTNIIRGAVDTTDYREYILPLVYYKIVSDEFERQYEQNIDEYGSEFARNPDLYDIPVIPEGHEWSDLQTVNVNIDRALNETFDALINENSELRDTFSVDYVQMERLDDPLLSQLIEHLSKYELDRDNVPQDIIGKAFRNLIHHFSEKEGKRGGYFSTPPKIAQLCAQLLDDFADGDTFHDPTAGTGGMLIEVAEHYREQQGGNPSKLRITGQEINSEIAAVAQLSHSIHPIESEIKREDSLTYPQFTDGNELERFDYVLANFPFSMSWPKDKLQNDPYGRFDWDEKLPRADRGDYAFIMHIAKQLKRPECDDTGGRAAIIIPHGVLFRKPEQRYRKYMIENDMVEAIVGLPGKSFPHTSIPTAILVLNTDKPAERQNEIQIIHAAQERFYEEFGNQNNLTDDGISHIVKNFRQRISETGVSQTVSIAEIRNNDYDLDVSLYIEGIESEKSTRINQELTKLEDFSYEGKINITEESTFATLLGKLIQKSDNTVIVLGSYQGANEPELLRVKNKLEEKGFDAHLFKDLPEFPDQDLSGSVATAMRLVGFCVMVDREASGHIDEYRIAEKQRTLLARLVPEDGGSTRMIGGSELVDINYINSFKFDFEPQERLDEAVEWAEKKLEERQRAYEEHYDWRE